MILPVRTACPLSVLADAGYSGKSVLVACKCESGSIPKRSNVPEHPEALGIRTSRAETSQTQGSDSGLVSRSSDKELPFRERGDELNCTSHFSKDI